MFSVVGKKSRTFSSPVFS